jgi:pimeloyl-ACP methyl ester carboxylesterase
MIGAAITALAGAFAGGWAATGLIGAAAETAVPPAGHFVAVDGGRLHYVDTGPEPAPEGSPCSEKPAVVLLHGASSHHADLFHMLARPLRGAARVIAFDRPGQGWSDRLGGREMASPARQADAVAQALDVLGTRRAIIVAHSLAGAMAVRMGLERPDLIAGIVLLGAVTHPWPGGKTTWYYSPSAHPVLGPLLVRGLIVPAGALLANGAVAGVFAPQAAPLDYASTASIRLALRANAFEANAQDVECLYDFVAEQAARHRELAMPVTAIAGARDSVVWTDVHSRAIAEEATHGRLIVLPGVGHMPHHAAPGLIAAETLRLVEAAGGVRR